MSGCVVCVSMPVCILHVQCVVCCIQYKHSNFANCEFVHQNDIIVVDISPTNIIR